MNDGDALHQAVLEQPDDDTPRLVYADWLHEHGQEVRAEFIRTHIAWARGETGLRTRVRELWRSGNKFGYWPDRHWNFELAPAPNLPEAELPLVRVSRGFGSHVFCDFELWYVYGGGLIRSRPLREVRLFSHDRCVLIAEISRVVHRGLWRIDYYEPNDTAPYSAAVVGTRDEMVRRLLKEIPQLETELM